MAGDANNGNVVLRLHCDGTNGSTTFTDTSITPKIPSSVAGNAQISTAQYKFGGASMLLDGTGDYLSYGASSDFAFGTGDFTVELFARLTGASDYNQIIGTHSAYGPVAGSWRVGTRFNSVSKLWFSAADGSFHDIVPASATLSNSTWYHLAIVKLSGTVTLYVDGVPVASGASAYNLNHTGPLLIGYNPREGNYINGNIDEVRITKGVACYTADFSATVPSAPFLDYAGQVSGVVRDSSNAVCARTVRAYDRSTGALVASTTSDSGTGAYTLNCATLNEVSVLCLDDVAGTTENDLVLRTTPG